MDSAQLPARARRHGVNPFVYWVARAVLQPFLTVYFRLSRLGPANIPVSGPVIFAANHRSFLDPFVIGLLVRRPIYYMAKRELFARGVVTDRIWPCVMLQWEWLGGPPPQRPPIAIEAAEPQTRAA